MIKILIPYNSNKAVNNIIIYQVIRFIGRVELEESRRIMESMRNQEDVEVTFSINYWTNVEEEFKNREIKFQILN